MNKRRGRPKGVLNSTIIKLQSLSISPMKLPSKNVAESLLLSSGQDPISKDSISQVVKGGFVCFEVNFMRVNSIGAETANDIHIPILLTFQLDVSSASKEVENLKHRSVILANLPLKVLKII
jgi:hypothetical protein